MKISEMSGKLKGIPAICFSPFNEFCDKAAKVIGSVCHNCYSRHMLSTYRKTCGPAFKRNAEELSDPSWVYIPKTNVLHFRFLAHGELTNIAQLENFIKIAKHNPMTNFAMWTKRKDLVSMIPPKDWPLNFIKIYSNPDLEHILNKVPKGFHKVFNVSATAEVNCNTEKCIDCLKCYRLDTEKIIVERLKPYKTVGE